MIGPIFPINNIGNESSASSLACAGVKPAREAVPGKTLFSSRDPDELMVCPECKEWTTRGEPCCGVGGYEEDEE